MAQKRKVNTLQRGENFAMTGYRSTADYCPETSCRIATALARLGNATDIDFGPALGISIPEFHAWKRKHPEFAQAVKAPPAASDDTVKRSLLRSALGFDYKTKKVISTREGVFVRTITKHHSPDVEALDDVLRVRLPRRYGAEAAMSPFERMLQRFAKQEPPAQAAASEETVDDEICRVAYVMSRLWASDREIAAALGFSLESFSELRDRHPELAEALKSGKESTDAALERALAHRAGGYHYVEEEIFCSREGDIKRTQVSRYLPADLKALELWLRAHPATQERSLAS